MATVAVAVNVRRDISVTVTVCLPGVSNVTLKVMAPFRPATKAVAAGRIARRSLLLNCTTSWNATGWLLPSSGVTLKVTV